jgi:heme-degrading monooxygenase HmoA
VQVARTPEPPYYAVIFTSVRGEPDDAYERASQEMLRLAAEQPGYLGVESARNADGLGITVSYWRTPAAMQAWKANAEHLAIQRLGRARWYTSYRVRVCKVEREYGLEELPSAAGEVG